MSGMKANEKIVKKKTKNSWTGGKKKKPPKKLPNTRREWKCYTIPSKHMWIVFFHVSDEESGVQVPAFVFSHSSHGCERMIARIDKHIVAAQQYKVVNV